VTARGGSSVTWTEIGRSETSPTENKVRKEVKLDSYYVVVGFEVNKPEALVDGTHDLSIDYGHAFFYLVKNGKIVIAFSFGPDGPGKVGWFGKGDRIIRNEYNFGALLKDGSRNSRPGTPDYPITERVRAFQIKLSLGQAKRLEIETKKLRSEIFSQETQYNAIMNDTCAETAKEILDDAGIETPSGYGPVKHSQILPFSISYSVNPYKWHENFRVGGYQERTYKPDVVPSDWHPPIGITDPIFGANAK
jgi:hypothetical protein